MYKRNIYKIGYVISQAKHIAIKELHQHYFISFEIYYDKWCYTYIIVVSNISQKEIFRTNTYFLN